MNKLYDRLVAYDPSNWGQESKMAQSAGEFRTDFENAYSRFVVGVPDDNSPRITLPSLTILERQIPLALYFSRFSLDGSGSDLYSKLLSRLKDCSAVHKCFFGSLNYDALFEQSVSRMGLLVDYSCEVGGYERLRVAKLHGACNFVTKELSHRARAHFDSPGAYTNGEIEILAPSSELESQLRVMFQPRDSGRFPIMSQITPEKQTYYGALKIQAIRDKWLSAAREAEVVAVVGVSRNPNDRHVVETIKQCRARILYIGGKSDFEKWFQNNARFEFIGLTFDAGFAQLVEIVCAACALE